jgi:hypothetical protein
LGQRCGTVFTNSIDAMSSSRIDLGVVNTWSQA